MEKCGEESCGRDHADQPEHRDERKHCDHRCGGVNVHSRIGLACPGTERRVRDVRRAMVMGRAWLSRMEGNTAGGADRQRSVEHHHADGKRYEPALHFVPSSTCRTSAIESWLSQARGPTARPTG